MPDSQMLHQKADELETAVSEVQQELSRADASRRSEAHERLAALVKEARAWLDETKARGADASANANAEDGVEDGERAAADARKAEEFLHEIRMHRSEL